MGVCDRKFRLVDWNWPRRDFNFRDFIVAAPEMANVDQPVCGSDDAFCGGVRGNVSAAAYGTTVAFLLDDALSEHDVFVATIPQPAGVGRFCCIDIRDGVIAILVCGTDSGFGDAAGSREKPGVESDLRNFRNGLARVGGALAPV